MAFLDGRTVADALRTGPLDVIVAVDTAIQACRGLEAAHAKGIVHRDIKPSNLMLVRPQTGGRRDVVKILDFGVASYERNGTLTGPGATLGTIAYMSPEQIASEAVDHRTDLWSLGVTLYEMLAGRSPFNRPKMREVAAAIAGAEPAPLADTRDAVSVQLERIVDKLLRKSPGIAFSPPLSSAKLSSGCVTASGQVNRRQGRSGRTGRFRGARGGRREIGCHARRAECQPLSTIRPKGRASGFPAGIAVIRQRRPWIYSCADRTGWRNVWRVRPDGTGVEQVTDDEACEAFESSDGRYLFYSRLSGARMIRRLSLEDGSVVEYPEAGDAGATRYWAIVENGIYFVDGLTKPGWIQFLDFSSREVHNVAPIGSRSKMTGGLAVSPDGGTLLSTQRDIENKDVMLLRRKESP